MPKLQPQYSSTKSEALTSITLIPWSSAASVQHVACSCLCFCPRHQWAHCVAGVGCKGLPWWPRCRGVGCPAEALAPLLGWASAWLSRPCSGLITRPYHVPGARLILTARPRTDPTGYEPNELLLTGWLQTSNPRVPLGGTATVTLFTPANRVLPLSPSVLSLPFLLQLLFHLF